MKANAFAPLGVWPQVRKWIPCILTALLLVLGPTACRTSDHAAKARDGSVQYSYAALELNHGKRWVVAKPMMVHIQNLEKQVQNFERTPGGDDAALAQDVQQNLGRFVTNCTMEGQAHEELHKWLMPLLGLSAEYAKATEPRVQQEKRKAIIESLQVFHLYFK